MTLVLALHTLAANLGLPIAGDVAFWHKFRFVLSEVDHFLKEKAFAPIPQALEIWRLTPKD